MPGSGEVQLPQVPLLHIVKQVSGERMRGPLTLQLEDDHAGVVARGKEIEGGMAGNDPEAVVLPPEGVEAVPLAHVPHPVATGID